MRKTQLENNKYYHIYNRGVDKRDIFCDDYDFVRFVRSMREFNVLKPIGSIYDKDLRNKNKVDVQKEAELLAGSSASSSELVSFTSYCLNKNHYHFILKQVTDDGIKKFMHRIGTGYTKYFNQKYKRSGSLFQGRFKAKHIDTEKYLMWLSAYINGNSEIHKKAKTKNYKWSSYQDYLNTRNGTFCNKEIVLNSFDNNISEYEAFVNQVINDSQNKKDSIKEYLSELE